MARHVGRKVTMMTIVWVLAIIGVMAAFAEEGGKVPVLFLGGLFLAFCVGFAFVFGG
jgi:hypothetical protein